MDINAARQHGMALHQQLAADRDLLLSYSTTAMHVREGRKTGEAPQHAPALYSNIKQAAESQHKLKRLNQKGGILMSTFI